MRVWTGIAAAAVAVVLTGGVQAETRPEPAELPPASYSGNQYIDSKGCVFLRAEFAGTTSWVARLGRDKKPVCGYDPTVIAAAAPKAAPAPEAAPEPEAAPVAAAVVVPKAKATVTAKPAKTKAKAARKPAPVVAEPGTLALVSTKRVGRAATYCPGQGNDAHRYLLSDGKRVTRCASADGEALAYINGLNVPGIVVSDRAPTARETRRATRAEQGEYRLTWVRGDLSPEGEAAFAAAAGGSVIIGDGGVAAPAKAVPAAASAAPAIASAGPYIQIGAFADPANAERALQTLGGLGLPTSVGVGGKLKVILAGPFGSAAELSNAMTLVRQNGYRDAFAKRG